MSKFLRKQGTIPYKFQIDFQLKKIEFNVTFPCRLSVVLKRGSLKFETKNAALVDKGEAFFNETFSFSATFYHDIQSKSYLEKEANLTIQTVTQRGTKLAGTCNIDLTECANLKISEKDIIIPIEKCIDKNAKLYFHICVTLIEEIKEINPKEEVKRANANSKSPDENLSTNSTTRNKNPRYKSPNSMSIRSTSTSPMGLLNKTRSKETLIKPGNVSKESFINPLMKESDDGILWKNKSQDYELIKSESSEIKSIHKSTIKTRDTSADQSSGTTLSGKTPPKHNLKVKEFTPILSKKKSEILKPLLSNNNGAYGKLNRNKSKDKEELKGHASNGIKGLDTQNINLLNRGTFSHREAKSTEEINNEALSFDHNITESELNFYQNKITALMEANLKLENKLLLMQQSCHEFQKLNEELSNKLEHSQNHIMNVTLSNNSCNGLINENNVNDLMKRILELENINLDQHQLIDYLKLENENLKEKINTQLEHYNNDNSRSNKSIQVEINDIMRMMMMNDHALANSHGLQMKSNNYYSADHHGYHDDDANGMHNELDDHLNISDIHKEMEYHNNVKLIQEYKELKSELDIYHKKCEQYEHELIYLRNVKRDKMNNINDLSIQLKSLKMDYQKLKGDLNNMNILMVNEHNKTIQAIDEFKKTMIQNNNNENKGLDHHENALIKHEYDQYIDKINELEIDNENLRAQLSEKCEKIIELQNMISNQHKMIENIKNAQKILANEDKILNEKLLLQVKSLEYDKEKLQYENTEYIIQINQLNDNINDLRQLIEMNNKQGKSNIRPDIDNDAENKILLIQGENDKLKRHIEELIDKYEVEKAGLTEQYNALMSRYNKSQETVKKQEEDKELLRCMVNGQQNQVNMMEKTIQSMQNKVYKTKCTLAKVINSVLEYGEGELIENIEQYIVDNDTN